jgi:hypothetical protein
MRPRSFLLIAIALLGGNALAACSSDGPPEPVGSSQATLRRAQSCSDLTAMLQADALSKMNQRVDAQIRAIREGWTAYGYGPGFAAVANDTGAPSGAASGSSSAGAAAPVAATPAAGTTAPPAHSDTETQVKGVDEADIVKTDGTYLYVLHGDKFLVVDAWPAVSLSLASSLSIEGEPLEMFVTPGQAVVFSLVDGVPIYSAAGVTPRPAYSDAYAPGAFYGGGAVAVPGVAAAGPTGSGPAFPGSSSAPLAKVTVLSIQGTTATVARELYFEGSYLSSRRIDERVRVILGGGAHGPALSYSPASPPPSADGSYVAPTEDQQVAAWEALRRSNAELIAKTTYADWLPYAFVKTGGQVTASMPSCSDFYVPGAGTTDFGLTQIESFDLGAPAQAPTVVAIVGSAETVYGNDEAMVLAAEAFPDPWVQMQSYGAPVAFASSGSAPGGQSPPQPPVETLNHTHLHLFDIASDPTTPRYVASGTVPGDVLDQFALDEKNGSVRVTTTEQRTGPALPDGHPNQASHVFVLQNDRGRLDVTGDAGEIAPGETLYATRYVGDKGYVVTWNVTDPLFVVDVADPHAPKVLGQVQIPGFSTYIHPLDDTHLLTIGRETDDTGHQHTTGGYWFGIAIQVFDVTNPLAPSLMYKYVYDGGEYATTEAMDNHKAFTYFDDKKLLAFPYEHQGSYGTSGPSSTLEVFQVGVAEGIQKLGSVDHSGLLATLPDGYYGYCGGYYDGSVRRGVFIGNDVFSISYGGIIASDVSNLSTPIATLKLDPPTMAGICPAPGM